ncbi:hypothetical protein VS28_18550, partial [Vibrio cholerae O1 biovar El Tor]
RAALLNSALLTASSAFFSDFAFAFASIAVSAAEKRDYEEVFIVCQVASFDSLRCLAYDLFRSHQVRTRLSL